MRQIARDVEVVKMIRPEMARIATEPVDRVDRYRLTKHLETAVDRCLCARETIRSPRPKRRGDRRESVESCCVEVTASPGRRQQATRAMERTCHDLRPRKMTPRIQV